MCFLSVGGVFEKYALDTISFPGFCGSFRAKHGWCQADLCTLNVKASRELPPLPIPFSSIYDTTTIVSFNNVSSYFTQPGSVSLKLESDGGHYASSTVVIPNGAYEGQLVIGDSFIYPVKKFTVNNSNDLIVLQFNVEQGKESPGKINYY